MPCAQPSSRSMVALSKVSFCHISNSLMAVLGIKLQPTGQGCILYQALAFSAVHTCCWAKTVKEKNARQKFRMILFIWWKIYKWLFGDKFLRALICSQEKKAG